MNESLDSQKLKAFVVLAQTGSYTTTARKLCVTHSAICHAMRALEAQLGCRLLSKLGKKAVLTEAGEALLAHAQRVLQEMRQARQTLTQLNHWGTRRLRLAAEAVFMPVFLPPVLVKFHREFPGVRLEVETCGCESPADRLAHNDTDIILAARPPAGEAVTFVPLLADRFQLVVGAGHPLAAKKSVGRAELGQTPCLLWRTAGHVRKQLDEWLTRQDIRLNILGEIESVEVLKELVRRAPVMSLLPGWLVLAEVKAKNLMILPAGRARWEQTWGFSHARPLNHVEAALLKLCRQRVAEMD